MYVSRKSNSITYVVASPVVTLVKKKKKSHILAAILINRLTVDRLDQQVTRSAAQFVRKLRLHLHLHLF